MQNLNFSISFNSTNYSFGKKFKLKIEKRVFRKQLYFLNLRSFIVDGRLGKHSRKIFLLHMNDFRDAIISNEDRKRQCESY